MPRDIDRIIEKLKEELPRSQVTQLEVSHPGTDDDGLWRFKMPASGEEIQLQSSDGNCPFLIESDFNDERFLGQTVEEVILIVRKLYAARFFARKRKSLTNRAPKLHFFAAWLVGGIFYMILAAEVVADAGVIAIPFQFIMGVVFSIIFVGLAALIGLLLRIPPVARFWYSSCIPSIVVLACAVFVIFFGQNLGITTTLRHKGGSTYQTLHPTAAYGSMLAAVFATLHFSRRRVFEETH